MKKVVSLLITTAIIIIYPLCSVITVSVSGKKAACDTQSGISVVEELDRQSVDDAQAQINKTIKKRQADVSSAQVQKAIAKSIKQIQSGQKSYRQVFDNVYFMGDSLMEGLHAYNILNPSRLITQVSAGLSHLEQNMNKIINARPPILIIHYGLNSISTSDAQIDAFVQRYTTDIKKLKKALPQTRIIISLLFPINTSIATAARFKAVGKFNNALKIMCKSLSVEYLDSTSVINANKQFYEPDGIHMKYSFYGNWLEFIMKEKGIY
ncbi:MAG: GDSL-type esterase/lipase family protein [Acutalibacteraceae bacterium]